MSTRAPEPAVGDLSADGTHVWGGHTWEPLSLVSDDVVDAARACFGQDVTGPPTFMTEGLMNESWHIASTDGAYVLRVSRPDLSHEQVKYEHAVAGQLHDTVREVVAPLPGRDGETMQTWQGRALSLFPYVDGVLGTDVEAATRWQQGATILARIHRASTSLAVGRSPDQSRMVDEQPTMWATVRPVLAQQLPPTAEVSELLRFFDSEAADLEAWLDGVRASGRRLRRGVVHGDFNPRNLIFGQDQLVAVIDWESCRLDALACETAGVSFEAPDPLAFWRTYLDAGGPLTADDIELSAGFARIGTLTGLYFTTDGGDRAKPWAFEILRDVAGGMRQVRERVAQLGLG